MLPHPGLPPAPPQGGGGPPGSRLRAGAQGGKPPERPGPGESAGTHPLHRGPGDLLPGCLQGNTWHGGFHCPIDSGGAECPVQGGGPDGQPPGHQGQRRNAWRHHPVPPGQGCAHPHHHRRPLRHPGVLLYGPAALRHGPGQLLGCEGRGSAGAPVRPGNGPQGLGYPPGPGAQHPPGPPLRPEL